MTASSLWNVSRSIRSARLSACSLISSGRSLQENLHRSAPCGILLNQPLHVSIFGWVHGPDLEQALHSAAVLIVTGRTHDFLYLRDSFCHWPPVSARSSSRLTHAKENSNSFRSFTMAKNSSGSLPSWHTKNYADTGPVWLARPLPYGPKPHALAFSIRLCRVGAAWSPLGWLL